MERLKFNAISSVVTCCARWVAESVEVELGRLLRPKSIVVMGGSWARSVIEQCQRMGFAGDIWPVHPRHTEISGLPCVSSLEQLPGVPDAAFIGVNRKLTINAVKTLSAMGAGGVVCFASGFSESAAEDLEGIELQSLLLDAAGAMPLIGPNCYGFINYLDGALLWPDQHGGQRTTRGVALITQSSNIAINLTMQTRGLPIAYVLTAGNQAQLSIGQLGSALLEDKRVTALALHIEGFGNIRSFEQLAHRARELGKPIIALKVGRSIKAQQAMISHTNSLTGSDVAADTFLARLGIARLNSLSALLETLKVLHVVGPLEGTRIHSMSCSGGEASLMADAAVDRHVSYPALTDAQRTNLREALGPLVALNNPLDYHTYIWNDLHAMTAAYAAMLAGSADMSLLVNDFPREDRCEGPSWLKTIDALKAAREECGGKVGMLATLPENMPEQIAKQLIEAGIVPFLGIEDTMNAIQAAAFVGEQSLQKSPEPILQFSEEQNSLNSSIVMTEAQAKSELKLAGLMVPASVAVSINNEALAEAASHLNYPVVLKGLGVAHKTEAKLLHLNLVDFAGLLIAADKMRDKAEEFLLEEYISDSAVELLVSIVKDASHGMLLTVAAGGVLTELLADAVHLLLPFTSDEVREIIGRLRVAQVLAGYRGMPGANIEAIVTAIMALQKYAIENSSQLQELEVNPLLCGTERAVVADALIRLTSEN